MIEVYIDE